LDGASFRGANLAGTNFNGASCVKASFDAADLSHASVQGTNLEEADLRNALLTGVDLYRAKLQKTRVNFEDLQSANVFTRQLDGDMLNVERRNRTRIFISYSHADAEFAERLQMALEKRSVDVWIDRDEILVGDSLIEKIREGIDASQFVCAIISPASVKSRWVEVELDRAMNQSIEGGCVKILPLLVEQGVELPSFLLGRLYVDFSRDDLFDKGVEQIMRRVNRSVEPI
jgi:predicted nucleotide-binding protein